MEPLILLKRANVALGDVLVWCLRVVVAIVFVFIALQQLSGQKASVEMFELLGLGQWFLYVSGALQLTAGIALLFPGVWAAGALILILLETVIMIADLLATGFASVELVLITVSAIIVWAGRDQLPTVLRGKLPSGQAQALTAWWPTGLRYLLPVGLTVVIVGGLFYLVQRGQWGRAMQEGAAAEWQDDFQGAVTGYTKAIQEAQQLPFAQREVVRSLIALGGEYSRATQLPQAEAVYRQAAQLSRESLDPHDPLYYESVRGLASVFDKQLRYAEAEALYLEAIAGYASTLPPPAEGLIARGYKKAGRLARWLGSPFLAAMLEEDAKRLIDNALNEQLRGLPAVMDGLADLYSEQREFRKAEEHYKRALILMGHILAGDSSDLGRRLLTTGLISDDQGKPLEGPALQQKLDPLVHDISVENRDHLAHGLNNLALTYWEEGRHIEAEPLYYLSLALHNPQKKSSYAMTLTNLGLLYNTQGRYAEAEPKLLQALAIRERALSPKSPDLGHSYNNLALLYDNQDQYAKAESFYQKALANREESLGPAHPKTVLTLGLLANLYFRQSQFPQAEPLYRRLLEIREQELGSANQTVLTLKWRLAGVYSEQGKYEDSLSLYERLIPHLEELVGPDNPRLINVLTPYAHVLDRAQKKKEAAQVRARIKELNPEAIPLPAPSSKRKRT